LCNFNKQQLILAKINVNNATSIGNQRAKFLLNLPAKTIVIAAFVRSPQNVKCPVLSNRLSNPDSVHVLLENSAINVLAPYFLFYLSSQLKYNHLQKITFCYCLH